jgi:hypothetical protein
LGNQCAGTGKKQRKRCEEQLLHGNASRIREKPTPESEGRTSKSSGTPLGRLALEIKGSGPVVSTNFKGILEFCRRNPGFRPMIVTGAKKKAGTAPLNMNAAPDHFCIVDLYLRPGVTRQATSAARHRKLHA